MSGDKVLIPLPGIGTLSLSAEAFAAALAEGSRAIAAPVASAAGESERWLTAEQLAKELNVPTTKIEAAARQGVIPSVRVGRYVRFRRSVAEDALTANGAA